MALEPHKDGDSATSISPMTRSPRPSSPVSKPADSSKMSLPPAFRSEPRLDTNGTLGRQGESPKDSLVPNGPSVGAPEFPFDAPPGTTGVTPTTKDLVHRIDHVPSNVLESAPTTRDDRTGATASRLKSGKITATDTGSSTPPGRRSVQFTRAAPFEFPQTPDPRSEQEAGEMDTPGKERHGSKLLSKLKAFAAPMSLPGHGRSLSGWTIDSSVDGGQTPKSEHGELRLDDDDDADAEDSAGEMASGRAKTKRKARRQYVGPATAPTTPRSIRVPGFHRSATERSPTSSAPVSRPAFGLRTNTVSAMSDIPENNRMGYSEDEGREHLNRRPRKHQRPSGLRRLTGIAGSSKTDGGPEFSLPHWRRGPGDRGSSTSAQKWRQLKAGLKLLSAKKKEDNKLDHAKSAELMAELLAGAPAALLLASMFQRDENNRKRIPVLLEQLKIQITDSQPSKNENDGRHLTFRIELEYASALVRMKWVINRTWRDFANLHLKYKVHAKSEDLKNAVRNGGDRAKLPRFPRTAVPYLRNVRGLYEGEDPEQEELTAGEQSGPDAEASGTDRPGKNKRRRSSFNFVRRTTTAFGTDSLGRLGSSIGGLGTGAAEARRETYAEKIRKRLELYLQQMIYYVIFRPDSNRLCKFLELSALGVRLAAEGGFHGKEGFMMIKSSKGVDFRKSLKPKPFVDRHSPKWFLVRQGYIVCVDSPDHMVVYDVHLVDPRFSIEKKKTLRQEPEEDENPLELVKRATNTAKQGHHQLKIINTERVTTLLAKNERHLRQFEESIKFMVSQSDWAKPHRFDSFAPARKNVWAQPLVDGQDYMWNVSRAISQARDVIFIHGWWISPEIYLRRPPAISQHWRLDRLLKRKADEGVKIFIIMYRNVDSAIPIDSTYTKNALMEISPNICIQRSPNQFRQNTFFWAHHEKLVVIDHCVAFCGGIDLCFGRWDTPDHNVFDDKSTGFESGDLPRDSDNCQLWPGKDYSNPRVQDFYTLDKPYEEMYDRTKVPRMPWHDISMQMAGQPARDLSRHFVQRWNFLLRQRETRRPRPMLLPPPDFLPADLDALDLKGTCEVQILRSASEWSLGTLDYTEHSIMNAYVESIRESDHFIYIENQFFITTCQSGDTRIENGIGDALVERITRAHARGERWRAVIVIPLMPGFQNTVDATDGTSVRLIMKLQYHSICRGDTSIFQRLIKEGIQPQDYINFYALRSWGRIGENKTLVTEQLYIHAKVMIVDDRIAIIGSANINERSMLGSHDSEIAAIVNDSDRIQSRMAGKDYEVSRFAHELRLRLMREHLGIDTDRPPSKQMVDVVDSAKPHRDSTGSDSGPSSQEVEEKLIQNRFEVQDSMIEAERRYHERRHSSISPGPESAVDFMPPLNLPRMNTNELGLSLISQLPPLPATDDTDIGGPPIRHGFSNATIAEAHPMLNELQLPVMTQDGIIDPLNESFYQNTWHAVAENNTKLFRLVFRCQPDNKVTKWAQYKDYNMFFERFKTGQHGILNEKDAVVAQAVEQSETIGVLPDNATEPSEKTPLPGNQESGAAARAQSKRRRRGATKGNAAHPANDGDDFLHPLEKADAEVVLEHVQGHLIEWPYDWLEKEMMSNNWDHTIDLVAPIEIYT